MTTGQQAPAPSPLGPLARYEKNLIDRITDFNDPRQEWRRLYSEPLGTLFLVLAAAGGGMMGQAFQGVISHGAAVVAPALTVMAIILFMGKISGAHLNPAVSIASSRCAATSRGGGSRAMSSPSWPGRPWPPCSCARSSTSRPSTGATIRPPATPPEPRSGWSSS